VILCLAAAAALLAFGRATNESAERRGAVT
jgi:hypothetical protein